MLVGAACRVLRWGLVAQGAVRPDLAVLVAPVFDDDLRLEQHHEVVQVQALVAEFAVAGLCSVCPAS